MTATVTEFCGTPRWVLMWLLVAILFFAAKCLVWGFANARPSGWRAVGWWLAWPGMDVEKWSVTRDLTLHNDRRDLAVSALVNLLLGVILLWFVARRFSAPLVAGWVGMIGLILVLHFGVMHLLSAFWQRHGVTAQTLMRNPAAATSLAEFWGRRWNIAFRDLAHRFVFRPAARRWGHVVALWMSFAVSGLAHEFVISVPAGEGFGLPTVYFLIQAGGISLERALWHDCPAAVRWTITHLFTVLPLGLLFHPPFVQRVMLPFFRAIGALP